MEGTDGLDGGSARSSDKAAKDESHGDGPDETKGRAAGKRSGGPAHARTVQSRYLAPTPPRRNAAQGDLPTSQQPSSSALSLPPPSSSSSASPSRRHSLAGRPDGLAGVRTRRQQGTAATAAAADAARSASFAAVAATPVKSAGAVKRAREARPQAAGFSPARSRAGAGAATGGAPAGSVAAAADGGAGAVRADEDGGGAAAAADGESSGGGADGAAAGGTGEDDEGPSRGAKHRRLSLSANASSAGSISGTASSRDGGMAALSSGSSSGGRSRLGLVPPLKKLGAPVALPAAANAAAAVSPAAKAQAVKTTMATRPAASAPKRPARVAGLPPRSGSRSLGRHAAPPGSSASSTGLAAAAAVAAAAEAARAGAAGVAGSAEVTTSGGYAAAGHMGDGGSVGREDRDTNGGACDRAGKGLATEMARGDGTLSADHAHKDELQTVLVSHAGEAEHAPDQQQQQQQQQQRQRRQQQQQQHQHVAPSAAEPEGERIPQDKKGVGEGAHERLSLNAAASRDQRQAAPGQGQGHAPAQGAGHSQQRRRPPLGTVSAASAREAVEQCLPPCDDSLAGIAEVDLSVLVLPCSDAARVVAPLETLQLLWQRHLLRVERRCSRERQEHEDAHAAKVLALIRELAAQRRVDEQLAQTDATVALATHLFSVERAVGVQEAEMAREETAAQVLDDLVQRQRDKFPLQQDVVVGSPEQLLEAVRSLELALATHLRQDVSVLEPSAEFVAGLLHKNVEELSRVQTLAVQVAANSRRIAEMEAELRFRTFQLQQLSEEQIVSTP